MTTCGGRSLTHGISVRRNALWQRLRTTRTDLRPPIGADGPPIPFTSPRSARAPGVPSASTPWALAPPAGRGPTPGMTGRAGSHSLVGTGLCIRPPAADHSCVKPNDVVAIPQSRQYVGQIIRGSTSGQSASTRSCTWASLRLAALR